MIAVSEDAIGEDELMELALESGAEDFQTQDGTHEVTCTPSDFTQVLGAIKSRGVEPEIAEITQLPQNTVKLDDSTARRVLRLMELLDDHDDVQNVYANYELSAEFLAKLSDE